MNKIAIILLSTLFVLACSSDKKTDRVLSTTSDSLSDNLMVPDGISDSIKIQLTTPHFISQKVARNHEKLKVIKGDCNSYKIYLKELDAKNISSIPLALDYIKTCLPLSDTTCQDAAFLSFNEFFYSVANSFSESLESNYSYLIAEIEENKKSKEAAAFENNLSLCGLGIFSSEGSYYLDVEYDYFYNKFKDRGSKSLVEFLKIRQKEMKQGFSEDAGLLISFDEVYNRVKKWEQYIKEYPESIKRGEAEYYYKTYLETIMTGMDNSRVFEGDPSVLSPEIKKLYEKMIKDEPESKTTKLLSSYYSFLKQNDFKETDEVYEFINGNHLTSMLGVQPHLR